MVNKLILTYLRQHSGKYPLEALKRKIISSGYSKREVDEAISYLKLQKKPARPIKMPIAPVRTSMPSKPIQPVKSTMPSKPIQPVKSTMPSKPITPFKDNLVKRQKDVLIKESPDPGTSRWMKISGFAGILIFVFSIIAAFFQGTIASQVLLSICAILSILFFYGFVVLGKKYEKRMVIAVSWIFIILGILFSLFGTALLIFSDFFSGILPPSDFSSIDSVQDSFSSLLELAGMYLLLIGAVFLIFIILGILFGVGLVKLKNEVKYAKLAGILNIIGFIALMIGIGVLVLLAAFILEVILLFKASKV